MSLFIYINVFGEVNMVDVLAKVEIVREVCVEVFVYMVLEMLQLIVFG